MSIESDTDLLNKNRELLDIAKLCVSEGKVGERGETFIIAQHGSGMNRLLWAGFNEHKGKWVSRSSYREVIQRSMRILRDVAERRKWRVRSTNAYTRQGTYLPQQMPRHVSDVRVHIVSEVDVIEEPVNLREAVGSFGSTPDMKQHTPVGLRRAISKLNLGNSFSNPL